MLFLYSKQMSSFTIWLQINLTVNLEKFKKLQGSYEMALCTSHLFPPLPHPRDIAGEFANKRC